MEKFDLTFPSGYRLMILSMTPSIGLVCRLLLALVALAAGGCTYSNYGDYHYPDDPRYSGHPVIDPPILCWDSRARI